MKKRVQFDFSAEQLERIGAIQLRLGAASAAEVVRRAIKLLDFATQRRAFVRGDDGVMRGLEIV